MMTWLEVPEVMAALHIKTDKKGTEKNNLNYQGGSYPPYVPPVRTENNAFFGAVCILQTIILPRQARDKHRKS
jgi:hypothetical protein